MAKISYDKKTNTVNVRLSNKKSVDSDVRGNVVIDYDDKGCVVGIDIMGISIGEFSQIDSYLDQVVGRRRQEKVSA